MKTFTEFVALSEEKVEEALTTSQRLKRKQTFRKNKAKIAMGRKRASRRVASPDKIDKRSRRAARREVEKKILRGKSKSDLSYGQRRELEKRVSKRTSLINRLARKMKPSVRKADREKLRK